ncbi:hypothetical protein ACQP2F_24745 [Actinoplanes sp. CA-030573]|uniref:hypothetical protein n=1 Tax=Actinoplanes sp. CA-030573 TaxID=3239898 RepID=UPI003D8D1385
MAWEWVTPVSSSVVALSGLASGYLIARRSAITQVRVIELQAERANRLAERQEIRVAIVTLLNRLTEFEHSCSLVQHHAEPIMVISEARAAQRDLLRAMDEMMLLCGDETEHQIREAESEIAMFFALVLKRPADADPLQLSRVRDRLAHALKNEFRALDGRPPRDGVVRAPSPEAMLLADRLLHGDTP